jgi:L-ascorbate metabolism protein UlaG (beta-lactamase superfamily)
MCQAIAKTMLWSAMPAVRQAPRIYVPPALPLPSWIAQAAEGAPLAEDELTIRWLGTACFEIRTAQASLLLDPYFSRPSLMRMLLGPVRPDMARIQQHARHVTAILIGHAHVDHMLDAPAISRLLNAPLYGSQDVAHVARAEGLSATAMRVLQGGERLQFGDLEVEAIESKHSDMRTNWLVKGNIPANPRMPMRFWEYKHGTVLTYAIRWRGRSIYHLGSAELVERHLAAQRADVALLCLSGWKDNPSVFKRLAAALSPRVLVPMHHDDFFRPLEAGFHEGQLAYVDEALATVAREMPQTTVAPVEFFTEYRLRAMEDA